MNATQPNLQIGDRTYVNWCGAPVVIVEIKPNGRIFAETVHADSAETDAVSYGSYDASELGPRH
jgi:hypothetical protein